MATPVLTIDDVSFSYGRRRVLRSVSLRIERGRSVAIMGRSGSGKSTLLACICGLLRPSSGDIRVLERSLPAMSARELARYRRTHLGVVFQMGELLPALTPVENVALPAMLNGASWHTAETEAVRLLEGLGVPITENPSMSLSGGERIRVAIARAMINHPDLVIADEPTGSLDTETRDAVADLIYQLPRADGCGLLVVTHDPAVAARADEVWRLEDGQLAPAAAVEAV